jgi:hypothetical protein
MQKIPSTLPRAIAEWPLSTAVVLTKSSGKEVATDTMVRPTNSGETPKRLARDAAAPTKRSAPKASNAMPMEIARRVRTTEPPRLIYLIRKNLVLRFQVSGVRKKKKQE